jgi:hypothetical protein
MGSSGKTSLNKNSHANDHFSEQLILHSLAFDSGSILYETQSGMLQQFRCCHIGNFFGKAGASAVSETAPF